MCRLPSSRTDLARTNESPNDDLDSVATAQLTTASRGHLGDQDQPLNDGVEGAQTGRSVGVRRMSAIGSLAESPLPVTDSNHEMWDSNDSPGSGDKNYFGEVVLTLACRADLSVPARRGVLAD
jgi:hypothetical protein